MGGYSSVVCRRGAIPRDPRDMSGRESDTQKEIDEGDNDGIQMLGRILEQALLYDACRVRASI